MSRYLVTGATGFLGFHLARILKDKGHDVVTLVRAATPELEKLGVTIRKGDILAPSSIADAAVGCDGVFHCAGKVSRRLQDAEELYKLHVEGTKNVLVECKKAGVKRAVVASTSGTIAVSDNPDFVATETYEPPIGLIQRWPYYRAKLFAEKAALEMNQPGFEVVIINPTLLLGPGDLRASSTEDVRLFLERKVPAVPAGGISYVDARDAAEAMRLAMDKGRAGERYLIGASNLTLKEFFARLERVSGVKAPWLPLPRAPELARAGATFLEKMATKMGIQLPGDPLGLDLAQYYWYLDSTKAETELGWTPRDPIETLADTVNDLRDRGVVVLDGPAAS